MTTQEIQAAWQASYEKHLARFMANAINRNPSPAIREYIEKLVREHVENLARKAADAEIRLLTAPERWL